MRRISGIFHIVYIDIDLILFLFTWLIWNCDIARARDASIEQRSNSTNRVNERIQPQKDFPAISCPKDTYPLITNGKARQCQPGNASFSCPPGFICYFDGIDRRYICCGRSTGYCDGGRPYLDPITYQPQRCQSNSSNSCRDPFECTPIDSKSEDGFCCLSMSNIEPPPVGCPWGTRPLRDANKKLLPCMAGRPNSCPGNTICYYDTVERSNRCCGRDPGEGCPTGTRAVKVSGQVVPCLPGDPQNKCPDKTICHWSYLIDRFQCCEADDGCPIGSSPYFELGRVNVIRQCLPDQQVSIRQPGSPSPSACPIDFKCEFNFWTASYQCCGKKSGLCPLGRVAFVAPNSNTAATCTMGQSGQQCPVGYICQSSTTGQGICCGLPGQCPAGSNRQVDPTGRVFSCSPGIQNACSPPAACLPGVGGPAGQYLCCLTVPINTDPGQCPAGYAVLNSRLTTCEPSSTTACGPTGSCLSSPSQPAMFLCCELVRAPPTDGQLCPIGYHGQGTVALACSPEAPTVCAPGARCLPSPSRPSAFYCCVASGAEASQCPDNYSIQDGQLIQCSPSSPICRPHAACLQSPSNPSLFLCCTYTSPITSSCPVGFVPQNGVVTTCSPSIPAVCKFGASCLQSSTNPSTYLCCTSVAPIDTEQCPVGFVRQDGQVVKCDPSTFAPCYIRAFCLASLGTAGRICCSTAAGPSPTFLQCPSTYLRQDNVAVQCNPDNPTARCSPSSSCLPALDQPALHICCKAASAPVGQCPPGYSLQNNAITQCTQSFPTCLAGSSCLSSPVNPSFYLCCTPSSAPITAAPSCSSGFMPPSTAPLEQCAPGSSTCPGPTQCVPSHNQPGVSVCCKVGVLSGELRCPGNGLLALTESSPVYCALPPAPSTCPASYACQPALNAPSLAICCTFGGLSPTCPNGGTPIPHAGSSGHYTFCSLTSPSCPSGATCEPVSNMVDTYVCCALAGVNTAYACPHDYTPLVDPTGLVTFCSVEGGSCPAPSTCLQAANNPQFHICCQPFGQSAAQCPLAGSQPLYVAGVVQTCSGPTGQCPQSGYTCQHSSTNDQYICCSTGPTAGVQCANGQPLYQPGSITFFCNPSLHQCPDQYQCLPSTLPGQSVCCRSGSEGPAWRCVSGADPFPNAHNPQTCTAGSTNCPDGTTCQLSNKPNQFVCCVTAGDQARCPTGATPFLEGVTTRRCTGPADLSCPAPYTCAPSDQPNIYICCRFISGTGASALACYNGAQAYIPPGSSQAQQCTTTVQTCPVGFSCQASTSPGTTVCCGSVQQGALYCPDGTPALVQGSQPAQPIVCSSPSVFCPAPFACIETPSSPGTRVCCPAGGSSASGRAGATDVCGPAQQPQLVNGQPAVCQIGPQQPCVDGYICQDGGAGVYYCCQGPMCPSGVTLLDINGHPRFCNPATNSCPAGSTCHQSTNLPGSYICCMTSVSYRAQLARCIGRGTHMLPEGRPQMCTVAGPNVCPAATECSSFTTTSDLICCSSLSTPTLPTTAEAVPPVCPEGDPYRDTVNRQYHYCSDTNYACPDGFVCKRAVNNPGHYVCCSARTTCQKGWAPYMDRTTNSPSQCSPFDLNSCTTAGPQYKCQQSTRPGEYLCCMETGTALSRQFQFNDATIHQNISKTAPVTKPPQPPFRMRNGG